MSETIQFVCPRDLCAGRKYQWKRRVLEFVTRVDRCGMRPAKNIFMCADYVGLNGPDDRGLVEFSDKAVRESVWLFFEGSFSGAGLTVYHVTPVKPVMGDSPEEILGW